ncbi:iron-containing alcohol dehydrogenase [Planosporangium thailandense]|uniref:Iron-containing alcohol dehydrogenase n=1 Tax=Planosporangium thailandense TaxID=765197 RepID=A0ABX0Y4W1_9ACTN|nr:iron-containing alcohol dehydrogenase [Planosporangium thailandense]NJC73068.1 iron-containing alcohol dehydrogenase [Planosporangium thailandense]
MTISPFANHLPVKIQFGEGTALQLPKLLQDIGADRVVVLLDEGIEQYNPAVAQVLDALRASALTVTRVSKPAGEPTIAMIDAATARIREAAADAVVALGGGSVIDTAKAARLCVQLGCTFGEFLASALTYPAPDIPLIAVPTTAGTGSEVSGGSVVSDPETGRKAGIANPHLRPQHAVIDPQLTWSMPPSMTANTGIDALAQAIAAVVAKVRTPIGDAIALEAVRLMGDSLLAAYLDGGDRVARSRMACGSMMAGLAMNISDCTAEHSLGQAIGGLTGAAHGLTVGLVLAETLERERQFVPDRLERVADALGVPPDGTHDGSRAVAGIRNLLANLGFPVLSGLGITETDLDRLTDLALADYFLTMSPHPWSRQEVRGAFASALALQSRQPAVVAG